MITKIIEFINEFINKMIEQTTPKWKITSINNTY